MAALVMLNTKVTGRRRTTGWPPLEFPTLKRKKEKGWMANLLMLTQR